MAVDRSLNGGFGVTSARLQAPVQQCLTSKQAWNLLGQRRKCRVGIAQPTDDDDDAAVPDTFSRTASTPAPVGAPLMGADEAWKVLGRRQRGRMANVRRKSLDANAPAPAPVRTDSASALFRRVQSAPGVESPLSATQHKHHAPSRTPKTSTKIADLFFQQELIKMKQRKANFDSKKKETNTPEPGSKVAASQSPLRNSTSESSHGSGCSRNGSFRMNRSPSILYRARDRRRSSSTNDLRDCGFEFSQA
eukprot:CAMPEP_0181330280 /NCGR_PEP_ID=MMETSP1101-20121128/23806_1 /TAXON_ID=46948 /ORGANISM="Rhodomonas abbreviata, Strain Caron Lab Isolate" /LENGTH=248 /DNA_ID=CAMNT_0023439507 /DNA_START=28 /DNA_END=770 /DNA_ORIENTATION=+